MAALSPEPVELLGRPGEPLTDALRRTLLDMIVYGRFEHGERLYPQALASRFGVSQTPVREAMMRIAAEGFLAATPRRGYRILEPTPAHVKDLWNVRLGLEQTAGRLTIERLIAGEIGDSDVARLAAIQDRLDAKGRNATHREHVDLNAEFHRVLVGLSGNRLLETIYDAVRLRLVGAWVQRGLKQWRERLASEAAEHRALIAALRGRDADRFARAAHAHIGRSLSGALDDLARRTPKQEPEGRTP
jgi:DNA-binding GntR family transcriptional regulator